MKRNRAISDSLETIVRLNDMNSVSVIIAAAGSGERMGNVYKPLIPLCGKPVIIYSLEVFQNIDEVSEIIISAKKEHEDEIISAAEKYNISKLKCVTTGGETRQDSVINGLKLVSKETKLVCVHDAARPLVKVEYVKKCIRDAEIFGASTLGVRVKDTLKVVDGGLVVDTPDRNKLFVIQTPQIFKKELYFKGVNFALEHELDFTDDCQLVEAVGGKVNITVSDYMNIKITTPEDKDIAEVLIKNRGKLR